MPNSLSTSSPVQLLLAPPAAAIQDFLSRHRPWIEKAIGCPLANAVTFEFHLPFYHLVLSEMFAGIPVDARCISYTKVLEPVVAKWELLPDLPLHIELRISRNRDGGLAEGKFGWNPLWNLTPFAVSLKGCTHAVVSAEVPYTVQGKQRGTDSQSLLIVNRSEMAAVLGILQSIEPPKHISVMAGRDIPLSKGGYCWDSVLLDAELDRSVRQDFESFFRREEWFRRHHLPFRRGYLLYGPPGNGKTTAARIMAGHPAVRAFGIDFRTAEYDAEQISEMFHAAAEQAPSLVILEDIDKVGNGDPDTMRRTLNSLLSCMDGLALEDGIIVVATANDTSLLGGALVKRPGRFDRVAKFPIPTPALRQEHLVRLSVQMLDARAAAVAAAAMDRFSFAQVKEAYVLAGQFAFDRGDDVTSADLVQAAGQMRSEDRRRRAKADGCAVGFSLEERDGVAADAQSVNLG
jgi:ATPase family protein associated with various cellular activities (AAA)